MEIGVVIMKGILLLYVRVPTITSVGNLCRRGLFPDESSYHEGSRSNPK